MVTAGTSVRESIALLQSIAKVSFAGLIVSVDRMERGAGEKSAIQEIKENLGILATAIVNLDEIVLFLSNYEINGRVVIDDDMYKKIANYRALYGAKY